MNWYEIFYWVTVADGVKTFFDVFSNVFTWLSVLSLIVTAILVGAHLDSTDYRSDKEHKSERFWMKFFRNFAIWMSILSVITWAGYVFTPSKKDAMVIIAGGAVGQFVTTDSSAKQIPGEVMSLLRNKIREMDNVSIVEVKDTLQNMTKEQLIELVKNKK